MLVDIEAFLFNSLVNTQAVQLLDAVEQDKSAGCCPEIDHEDAEQLSAEESPAKAVEGTSKPVQHHRQDR